MQIEICVESAVGAVAAQNGGAARVELCANLLEGGTTPSAGCITMTRRAIQIGLHVIIRPRGGDFLYDETERSVMAEDIRMAKQLGADGIVLGCLTAAGDIDRACTQQLVDLARHLQVTFHRAFDMCRDPWEALEELVSLGIERILTSGQEASCLEGLELIAELQRQARDRIIIMPGGGITERNAARVVALTGVAELHLSARKSVESSMTFRNGRCFMGGALRPPEFSHKTTDETAVRAVVAQTRT